MFQRELVVGNSDNLSVGMLDSAPDMLSVLVLLEGEGGEIGKLVAELLEMGPEGHMVDFILLEIKLGQLIGSILVGGLGFILQHLRSCHLQNLFDRGAKAGPQVETLPNKVSEFITVFGVSVGRQGRD
jgi:hypothetical protein